MAAETEFRKFHVAVSYSRKDQEIVGAVVYALKARGIRVYHDRTEKTPTWGSALDERLSRIYRDDACFCLVSCPATTSAANTPRWSSTPL